MSDASRKPSPTFFRRASEAESYNVDTDTLGGGGAVNTSGSEYNPANDTLGGGAAGFRPGVMKDGFKSTPVSNPHWPGFRPVPDQCHVGCTTVHATAHAT